MRDNLLFRGKTYNGEWAYGIAFPHDGDMCTMFFQQPMDGSLDGIEVDVDTVGQYTGHMDRNGRKIFDGDIVADMVRTSHAKDGKPRYAVRKYIVEWSYNGLGLRAVKYKNISCRCYERCEVLGNKWDNPELLEVERGHLALESQKGDDGD